MQSTKWSWNIVHWSLQRPQTDFQKLALFDLFVELRMRLITCLPNDKHVMAKSNPKRQYGSTRIIRDDSIVGWFCTIISAAIKQAAQSAFSIKTNNSICNRWLKPAFSLYSFTHRTLFLPLYSVQYDRNGDSEIWLQGADGDYQTTGH